jgi:hypothetical protein
MPALKSAIDASPTADLYQTDYQRWLFDNAALLRTGRLSEIDAANIAEELEDMGRSEARALGSHLEVLLLHLIKWQFQPAQQSSGWRGSIMNARYAISDLLTDSPSLRNRVPELVIKHYPRAWASAANETGLPGTAFPRDCPYALEALLDIDFWPG